PLGPLDPDLARALGIEDEEDDAAAASARPPAEPGAEAPLPAGHRAAMLRATGPLSPQAPRDDRPMSVATLASQQSLEKLLREGRPEFGERPWVPHRPPRPDKTEGGFRLVIKSDFVPQGDQPQAIAELVEGVGRQDRMQVLLGVTGSGKTYTMAKVIEATQRPALILAPNKTLAAQLYGEFRSFFPDNAVEYFVSYYDYYQPEA